MRICRAQQGLDVFYGELKGDVVYRLACHPFGEIIRDKRTYALSDVRLLAPTEPSKVVCIGKNYHEHAAEMGEGAAPEAPLLFLKPSTAVIGPEDGIVYPPDCKRLDYEAELGVVIKKRCKDVPLGGYRDVVLGYTCLNDVTARDIQKSDGQWTRGKGYDTFCPMGPWIETDLDPNAVSVESRLNGVVKQSANTERIIHNVDMLVYYITRVMTLLPGDVIATGTPAGIGPMEKGDVIEVEVGGIGVLRNRIQD